MLVKKSFNVDPVSIFVNINIWNCCYLSLLAAKPWIEPPKKCFVILKKLGMIFPRKIVVTRFDLISEAAIKNEVSFVVRMTQRFFLNWRSILTRRRKGRWQEGLLRLRHDSSIKICNKILLSTVKYLTKLGLGSLPLKYDIKGVEKTQFVVVFFSH